MIRTFISRQKTQLGVVSSLTRFSTAHQLQPETDQLAWDTALPYEKIPGPTILQLFRKAMKGGKYYNLSLTQLHQVMRDEYGPIVKLPGFLGKNDVLISFDPKDYEKVFRNEGNWPIRRGMETFIYYRKHVRKDIFKDLGGLVTEQGEPWHDFRTKVNPVMLQPKTVQLYTEKVDAIAREYMEMLAKMRDTNNELPADFSNELNKWALETMGIIALDTRLGVLYQDNTGDAAKMIQSIRDFFVLAYNLEVQPSLWKYYKTRDFKKMMVTFENLTDIIMKYVEDAAQNLKNSPPKPESERGVLEKLLQIDQHIAMVMAFDMLLAGVDTTSAAVISTLYCLSKNLDKQKKLRQEILTILPETTTPLTSQSMKNLPYLRAVIKESIRMYPVTSGNFRATGKDIVLQGYRIPKDVDVAMSALPMNEDEYIEDAASFIPERWLRDASTEIQKARDSHPFVYLPFGFGPRTCIGRRFAQLELEVIVSRIVRQFLVEWKQPPMQYRLAIINIPKSDLKFTLTDI